MATEVQHVSDTAFWVAYYRGLESKAAKPLFHDPLAEVLAGDKGRNIAKRMKGTKYTAWAVVIRTKIIDDFIAWAVTSAGVDAVLNLGAGLDTRPYRLSLPGELHWLEVDFPHVIQFKKDRLQGQTPKFHFEQISLDLTNSEARKKFLEGVNSRFQKVLVLTEGVVPYLKESDVADLAEDLHSQKHFQFWILDYFSKQSLHYLRKRRKDDLKNAPFQFDPENWHDFFSKHGWQTKDQRFLGEESRVYRRTMPMPWWVKPIFALFPKRVRSQYEKNIAYIMMERKA
jgi:methyltransferase (TIGR00027 family)